LREREERSMTCKRERGTVNMSEREKGNYVDARE